VAALDTRALERRLLRIGAALAGVLVLAGSALWGMRVALSLALGGALAAVNLSWIGATTGALFFGDPKGSKRRVLAGFILRLLLILGVLYATIRVHFLSPPAAVAGFTVFYCSILVAGVLEALESARRDRARVRPELADRPVCTRKAK